MIRKNVPTYFNLDDKLECELYDHLSNQISKGGYIKYLIEKDMCDHKDNVLLRKTIVVSNKVKKSSINIESEINDLEI